MCIRDRCIDIAEHTLIPSSPNNDTDEAELLKTEDFTQSASAVSYTHLDVYKRQVWNTNQESSELKKIKNEVFNLYKM